MIAIPSYMSPELTIVIIHNVGQYSHRILQPPIRAPRLARGYLSAVPTKDLQLQLQPLLQMPFKLYAVPVLNGDSRKKEEIG